MKTNPDDPASPVTEQENGSTTYTDIGLTKRERFAMEIHGRLIASHNFVLTVRAPETTESKAAKAAVVGADELIKALNEGRE